MFLLDWYCNAEASTETKHRCLSQTGQSTTWWWKKMLLLWLNFKAWGKHFTIWPWWTTVKSFCLSSTFPVNDSVFFCFLLCARCWLCCCGWITKLDGKISLPYLIGNRQRCYAYISALSFGWMYMIPFLKGNGINKKPNIIYIDFQVTFSKWCIVNMPKSLNTTDFWNSLELSSWIFKRTFWVFYFLCA